MQGLLRFARTAAGISAEQLWFQVLRRAQGSARPRAIDAPPAPASFWDGLRDRLRAAPPPADWDSDASAEAAIRGRWTLLGETLSVDPQRDWSQRSGRPLHSFHLQYHEQLRALARRADRDDDPRAVEAIIAVISRWIETTRAGGGDAWHPYPISVRTFVWFEVLALLGDRLPDDVRREMQASLASQLDVVARRRERQIGANHLQRNDAALAIGGLGFTGAHAARWRDIGLAGTWRALQQHVLADGMHYERSPMYHAGMLSDVLRVIECCEVAGVHVPDAARARVSLMATALERMTRVDGSLHQFNDTAAGVAPPTGWLLQRTAHLLRHERPTRVPGAWSLPEAGYAGWQDPAARTSVVFDAGPAGPREQPGHAQCDALSFELCVDGGPVLVNAGVHGYDEDPYREYSRSTRGHNTVQVGPHEQHEVWATFRVARFGTVEGPVVESSGDQWAVSGRVRGYAGGSHHRHLALAGSETIRVADTMVGADGETAVARWLLHPAFSASMEGDEIVARSDHLVVRICISPPVRMRLVRGARAPVNGWHFPTFGDARPAVCIECEIELPAEPLVTTITWHAV